MTTPMNKSVDELAAKKSHPNSMRPLGRTEIREQERVKRQWAIGRDAIIAIVICAIAYLLTAYGLSK